MSEFPSSFESNENEALRLQVDTIRTAVEERVSDEPLPQAQAEEAMGDFGLEPGAYTVFGESVAEFGGGFKRFVPKDGTSQVLEGLTFANIGGPSHNLNRSLHNMLLKPNGDLVGRITTENDEGVKVTDISWPASSDDSKSAMAYERHISVMAKRAEGMLESKAPASELDYQERDAQDRRVRKRGRGFLGQLRRRFTR